MTNRRTLVSASALALAATLAALAPAAAQVRYRTGPAPDVYAPFPYSDPSPYDQAYGTRPSFEILPGDYAYAPRVRVVERCLYPNGWNVTDFSRDINGIPPGSDHTCPETGPLRSRY